LGDIADSEWSDYWTATYQVSDRNGGAFKLPGHPWKFSDAATVAPGEPALQGEHNMDICAAYGLTSEEIERMISSGALVENFAASMIANVLGVPD
jgi:crotonobetainyl-CoA:carnitine CoA-transferase CaiB-like acyl-CoA transferase